MNDDVPMLRDVRFVNTPHDPHYEKLIKGRWERFEPDNALPVGNTSPSPLMPQEGMIRPDSDSDDAEFQIYQNGKWMPVKEENNADKQS